MPDTFNKSSEYEYFNIQISSHGTLYSIKMYSIIASYLVRFFSRVFDYFLMIISNRIKLYYKF